MGKIEDLEWLIKNNPQLSKDSPVVVVGVIGNKVTKDGTGSQRFRSLTEAEGTFPELMKNGGGFLGPMANGKEIRFETPKAYDILSS